MELFTRQRVTVGRTIARIKANQTAAAYDRWSLQVNVLAQQRDLMKRVLTRMRNSTMAKALGLWSMQVATFTKQRRILEQMVQRMRSAGILKAYATWADSVRELLRQRSVLERIVARMQHGHVSSAFDHWSAQVRLEPEYSMSSCDKDTQTCPLTPILSAGPARLGTGLASESSSLGQSPKRKRGWVDELPSFPVPPIEEMTLCAETAEEAGEEQIGWTIATIGVGPHAEEGTGRGEDQAYIVGQVEERLVHSALADLVAQVSGSFTALAQSTEVHDVATDVECKVEEDKRDKVGWGEEDACYKDSEAKAQVSAEKEAERTDDEEEELTTSTITEGQASEDTGEAGSMYSDDTAGAVRHEYLPQWKLDKMEREEQRRKAEERLQRFLDCECASSCCVGRADVCMHMELPLFESYTPLCQHLSFMTCHLTYTSVSSLPLQTFRHTFQPSQTSRQAEGRALCQSRSSSLGIARKPMRSLPSAPTQGYLPVWAVSF